MRDECKHGSLRRKCASCELERRIEELVTKLDTDAELLRAAAQFKEDVNRALSCKLVPGVPVDAVAQEVQNRIQSYIRQLDTYEGVREELARVQRLPELDWARVTSTILQICASFARGGYQDQAREIARTLDMGQVYVSRILSRYEGLRQAVAALVKATEEDEFQERMREVRKEMDRAAKG